MADELDGVIAFTEVLDRLVDAEKRAATTSFEVRNLSDRLLGLENDRDRVRRERDELQVERKINLPKLAALWQASESLLTVLPTHMLPEAAGAMQSKLADTLRKALAEAHDACDQIPF